MDTIITESRERLFPKKYVEDRNRYWDSYTKTFRIVGKRMENFETYTLDTLDLLDDGRTVSNMHLSKILFSDVIFTRFCSVKSIISNYGMDSLAHPCFLDVVLNNSKSGEYYLGKQKARSLLESETQYTFISTPIIYQKNLGISGLEDASRVLLTKEIDLDINLSVGTVINYNDEFHFISTVKTDLTYTDLNKLNKHFSFENFIGWNPESGDKDKVISETAEILKLSL